LNIDKRTISQSDISNSTETQGIPFIQPYGYQHSSNFSHQTASLTLIKLGELVFKASHVDS